MPRLTFPRIFQQHTLTVQPYTGWNSWGATTTVRGMYQEEPSRRHTRSGVVYRITCRFWAPLDTVCPDGSKVTLHDGRTGFVSYAIRRDGGALPVPSHLEIGIDLVDTRSSVATETVVLLRRTLTAERDQYGGDVYSTTEVAVAGCSVLELEHDEDGDPSLKRVVTTGRLVMPPGTVVRAVDRVRMRGLVYDVDGPGVAQDDPMAATVGPVELRIRRVSG